MKVTLFQAIRMAITLYAQGAGDRFVPILKHCLWSRRRGNELVDQGVDPSKITEILLQEEQELFN